MNTDNVELSREEYEKLLEMAEKPSSDVDKEENSSTETPTPTLSPEPTEAPKEIEYDQVHFDTLNIDLPIPDFDWNDKHDYQEEKYIYRENERGESMELFADQIDEDINELTGEPTVYDKYFIEDCDPEDIVDWSDKDNFFTIHASKNGFDTIEGKELKWYNLYGYTELFFLCERSSIWVKT